MRKGKLKLVSIALVLGLILGMFSGVSSVYAVEMGQYENKLLKVKIESIDPFIKDTVFSIDVDNLSSDADGVDYRVYNGRTGKMVCEVRGTGKSCDTPDLITRDLYYVKARAYKCFDDGEVYGEWSDKVYFLCEPSFDLAAMKGPAKKHSITLKWTKVKSAKKYEVYCSYYDDDNYKKVATTKKTSIKITKYKNKPIDLSKKMCFKVKAVTTKGGKTIKSETANTLYSKVYQ